MTSLPFWTDDRIDRVQRTKAWLAASGLLYREETGFVGPVNRTPEYLDRLSFASRLIVEQARPGEIVTVKVRT